MTICNGSNTSLTITATGGTGALTYSWSPGASLSTTTGSVVTANPSSAETYNVQVTDALGCVDTPTVYVTVLSTPTLTASATISTLCQGSGTTISASGADTYTWMPGSLVGASHLVTPSVGITTYTVVGTNTVTGCSSSATVAITVNPLPTVSAGPSRTLTCVNTSTTLAGSTTGGITFNWTGPGIVSGGTTLNPTINAPGTYDLSVVSAAGCSAGPTPVSITQNITPPSPTATSSGTLTCSTLTVALNGAPGTGVTYQWTGPGFSGGTTSQNAVANAAGSFTLRATSSINGCTNTAVTNVTQNVTAPNPFASSSGTLNCGVTTVTLTALPASGVTYSWAGPGTIFNPTSQTTAVNTGGTFTLSITSLTNGCSNTFPLVVSQNTVVPLVTPTLSGSLTCSTNTITAYVTTTTTPVTYNWTGTGILSGATTASITTNVAGIKNYVVTNSINLCSATGNVTVALNTVTPTVNGSSTAIDCYNATANVGVSTIATPVSYNWTGPGITSATNISTITVNQGGTYNFSVTNTANGCVNASSISVSQNTTAPSANAGMDQSLTCASPTVTLSGSATPSTCTPVWTGGVASGANSFNATTATPGTYTLTVTNPTNGCSATDLVQVIANASIPTITISVSNTLTCANTTATTSASSSAALPTYLWSGPSIVSGGTTANATVDQPGNYTLTVTDIPTGCSATSNINVAQDITLPNVTIISSPSVICSGNSSTLTGNGAVTYSWSTAQTTTSISVSPSSTDTYTVYGTGTNGCTNYTVETITVNSTPALNITGDINICNGSSTTLTGSGATSYTWDSGANTNTISVTPTVTTTYTLNGDNGNGCSSLLPVTVSIIANKSITGVITSTTGATGGDIIIYKYTAALSHWDSLTITPIGGTYSFNNIDSGQYVLRAMPTATNIQVTYAPNSISWQGATVINHGCTNNTSQNIDLIGFAPYVVGPGVVTGNIVEAAGFVPRMSDESKPMIPGTPIGGIIVKGGKNPGGQMFVQTLTDAAGNYTLTGLPINTLPDDYFIFVDIPGLDTNSTYYHISVTGSTPITGFDFNVDAQYINPIGTITGILNDKSVLENKITLFPNPANDKFTLEYELTQSANVQIELYDMIGHKVKTVTPNSFEEKNKYSHSVTLEDLSNGVYFVKIKINNSQTTIKLIIAD
jgi:hypothetical protein